MGVLEYGVGWEVGVLEYGKKLRPQNWVWDRFLVPIFHDGDKYWTIWAETFSVHTNFSRRFQWKYSGRPQTLYLTQTWSWNFWILATTTTEKMAECQKNPGRGGGFWPWGHRMGWDWVCPGLCYMNRQNMMVPGPWGRVKVRISGFRGFKMGLGLWDPFWVLQGHFLPPRKGLVLLTRILTYMDPKGSAWY